MNLLEFLLPFSFFRKRAIATVANSIQIVRQNNPTTPISIIAHSFGTYVVAELMRENAFLKFQNIILCGSVLPYDFPFEKIQDRFHPPIINEVGTRDIWPAVAESVTTGYGSAGTFGFRRPLVRDRWHNGAKHGYFLSEKFCAEHWVPWLKNGEFVVADTMPQSPAPLTNVLAIFKLKYVLLLALVLAAGGSANKFVQKSVLRYRIPDPYVMTENEFRSALKHLEENRSELTNVDIADISEKLTSRLVRSDAQLAGKLGRDVNADIAKALILLNDNDLSRAWKSLPSDIDLSYVDLSKTNLIGIKFNNTRLIHTRFNGAALDNAVFDGAWVRNADFSGSTISGTAFRHTDWFNANGLDTQPRLAPYSQWKNCPKQYTTAGYAGFILAFNDIYNPSFNAVERADAEALRQAWATYARPGGICEAVLL